jgi:predicted nucleic acid-binding Zn ribbon protein
MPTYEFRCPDGTVIEKFFKISEVPETITLPDGGEAVRMISGGAGLVFKGSGFYINDYGKDGKKDVRQAASKSASSASTGPADSAVATSGSASAGTGASAGTSAAPAASSSSGTASSAPAAPNSAT